MEQPRDLEFILSTLKAYDAGIPWDSVTFEDGQYFANVKDIKLVLRVGKPPLTDEYWDCECDRGDFSYIHKKSETLECKFCNSVESGQPDSHINEVAAKLLNFPYGKY